MDEDKKIGCIGYVLVGLITLGLTQGPKGVYIILGILLAIVIVVILLISVSKLTAKCLMRKIERKKTSILMHTLFFLGKNEYLGQRIIFQ